MGQRFFVVPAAGLLLRLFVIQHDCGHKSLFKTHRANDILRRCLSVLTLTPYGNWKAAHARHHATSGNLDRRGIGDIETLTLEEYRSRSRLGRLRYRMHRHPFVIFGVGPSYQFFIRHRVPTGSAIKARGAWVATMITNAAILTMFSSLCFAFGSATALIVHLPIVALAA